jgi:hypothetical protein
MPSASVLLLVLVRKCVSPVLLALQLRKHSSNQPKQQSKT